MINATEVMEKVKEKRRVAELRAAEIQAQKTQKSYFDSLQKVYNPTKYETRYYDYKVVLDDLAQQLSFETELKEIQEKMRWSMMKSMMLPPSYLGIDTQIACNGI